MCNVYVSLFSEFIIYVMSVSCIFSCMYVYGLVIGTILLVLNREIYFSVLDHCKCGNFNINIWAWFSYFICSRRETRFYLFGKELCNMCVYFLKILTVYTLNSHLLTLKRISQKMHVLSSAEIFLKPLR